jgi:transposase
MFFRLVPKRYGDHTYQYLQLVESYRDGKRTRQRVVRSFGNVAHLSDRERRAMVRSLTRALGLEAEGTTPEDWAASLTARDTRRYADLLALRTLWEDLQLPATFRRLAQHRAIEFDLELLAFLMVAHRLIDPGSKLALTRWLPEVFLAGYDLDAIQLQHCYRALDVLADRHWEVEEALFLRLSDLFQRELSLVFYDLTSTYFEGDGPSQAAYGYSRDRRGDQKQIVLALAVDRRGLPITHLVFPGNRVDHQTLEEALGHLQERFHIERVIFVADGGVMTEANVERLAASPYQHLIALPKRRALAHELAAGMEWTMDDVVGENVMARSIPRGPLTYLVCYNPERAEQEAQIRQRRLDQAIQALEHLREQVAAGRLTAHDEIVAAAAAILASSRTRKYFRFHSAGDGHFESELRRDVLAQTTALEGYYFLQTDAPDLDPSAMLGAYKTLQQVEHAFRELKDTIELRPIYHYADARVRGHVFVCVLAYLLERVLELRLEEAGLPQSARAALEKLEPIRVVRNQLGNQTLTCVVQRRPPGADPILNALRLSPLPVVLTS